MSNLENTVVHIITTTSIQFTKLKTKRDHYAKFRAGTNKAFTLEKNARTLLRQYCPHPQTTKYNIS